METKRVSAGGKARRADEAFPLSPYPGATNLAFQAMEFAKDHGQADEYNDAVFRAFFQQSRDIGSAGVLAEIAKEVGLDAAAPQAALQEGAYRDRVQQLLQTAYGRVGVTAVPTMIIGRQRLEGHYPWTRSGKRLTANWRAKQKAPLSEPTGPS